MGNRSASARASAPSSIKPVRRWQSKGTAFSSDQGKRPGRPAMIRDLLLRRDGQPHASLGRHPPILIRQHAAGPAPATWRVDRPCTKTGASHILVQSCIQPLELPHARRLELSLEAGELDMVGRA
jgi:hypothetical protein